MKHVLFSFEMFCLLVKLRLPEITSIADIYTEIFMSCDTILEELKEFVEIHEE